jgi:Tfp pilus assembly protein PilF
MPTTILRPLSLGTAGILLLFTAACGETSAGPPVSAGEILAARTLGLLAIEEHRLEDAEAQFIRVVRMAPDETAAHANLGLIYLRMGRYHEADQAIAEAVALAPHDADIRLMQATVYQLTDQPQRARRILHLALEIDPSHARVLSALAEADTAGRLVHLERLVEVAPANVAARLELTEALLSDGALSAARDQLEHLDEQRLELPHEAEHALAALLVHARGNHLAEAREAMIRARSVFATTPVYQAGRGELLGPAGAPPGYPVLSFGRQVTLDAPDPASVAHEIRFTDVTSSVGLDLPPGETTIGAETFTQIAVGDFTGEGYPDILVTRWPPDEAAASTHLFRNDSGAFTDIAAYAGIPTASRTLAAAVADYDNDGHLDLYLVNAGTDALYRNNGDGTFREVSRDARLADPNDGAAALFVDLDQGGTLDLFLATATGDRVYRGSPDGTFREQAVEMGLAGTGTRDAVFGDFDGDGRIDLVLARRDGLAFYRGLGGGRFHDATAESGLDRASSPRVLAAADYDRDGALDLVVLDAAGPVFYRGRGDGTFERDGRADAAIQALAGLDPLDAAFLDFDNDGSLDLVVVGRPDRAGNRGVVLLHNRGGGTFSDRSALLPDDLHGARQVVAFDFDADGALDLLLAGLDGQLRLLRNDGGNANQFVVVRLAALGVGTGQNNHFGIGARLELRAGDSFQTRTVTEPTTHFGLGDRLKVDVLRIVWPNGVPQTLHYHGTDADVLAEQALTTWGRPVPLFR